MRIAPRRDLNEPEIIGALEKAGAIVCPLDWTCDLLVRFRRLWHVLEVKTETGKLRDSQVKLIAKLDVGAVQVVRSAEEALRAIGAI